MAQAMDLAMWINCTNEFGRVTNARWICPTGQAMKNRMTLAPWLATCGKTHER